MVGCVARLMAQKNHTRLLDIFAALKKVRPDSCLLLVGEGELRAELEAKAARLGIAQDVKFLGVQSDTSVWYQAMDVFVMPSLFEGLPVVGMEAQASGLPACSPPASPRKSCCGRTAAAFRWNSRTKHGPQC